MTRARAAAAAAERARVEEAIKRHVRRSSGSVSRLSTHLTTGGGAGGQQYTYAVAPHMQSTTGHELQPTAPLASPTTTATTNPPRAAEGGIASGYPHAHHSVRLSRRGLVSERLSSSRAMQVAHLPIATVQPR